MLLISELFIYPIKSLGGIAVSKATVTDRGFEHDRRWMLVDAANRFLTQREHAQMALLQVTLTDEGLQVQHKTSGHTIIIPFGATNERAIAQIWDDDCMVQFVGSTIDEWFCDVLSINCRLVYMPAATHRLVEKDYAFSNELTSFTDGYPFLMIGQSSLDDLNNRLSHLVSMDRFRPSIVFTGGLPYQEDLMEHFVINGLRFKGVKPCGRCVVTTIDQQTANQSKEPLRTLATYRMQNGKVRFGQNLLVNGKGIVRVGDEINQVFKTE